MFSIFNKKNHFNKINKTIGSICLNSFLCWGIQMPANNYTKLNFYSYSTKNFTTLVSCVSKSHAFGTGDVVNKINKNNFHFLASKRTKPSQKSFAVVITNKNSFTSLVSKRYHKTFATSEITNKNSLWDFFSLFKNALIYLNFFGFKCGFFMFLLATYLLVENDMIFRATGQLPIPENIHWYYIALIMIFFRVIIFLIIHYLTKYIQTLQHWTELKKLFAVSGLTLVNILTWIINLPFILIFLNQLKDREIMYTNDFIGTFRRILTEKEKQNLYEETVKNFVEKIDSSKKIKEELQNWANENTSLILDKYDLGSTSLTEHVSDKLKIQLKNITLENQTVEQTLNKTEELLPSFYEKTMNVINYLNPFVTDAQTCTIAWVIAIGVVCAVGGAIYTGWSLNDIRNQIKAQNRQVNPPVNPPVNVPANRPVNALSSVEFIESVPLPVTAQVGTQVVTSVDHHGIVDVDIRILRQVHVPVNLQIDPQLIAAIDSRIGVAITPVNKEIRNIHQGCGVLYNMTEKNIIQTTMQKVSLDKVVASVSHMQRRAQQAQEQSLLKRALKNTLIKPPVVPSARRSSSSPIFNPSAGAGTSTDEKKEVVNVILSNITSS